MRLTLSLFSFSDCVSILVTSSISLVSLWSLAAFLAIASIITSLFSGCRCINLEYPRIAWVGVFISWLAMLINSCCILSWIFNRSLAPASESFAVFSSAVLVLTTVSNLLFHEKTKKAITTATAPIIVIIKMVKYRCWSIKALTSVARFCCALI